MNNNLKKGKIYLNKTPMANSYYKGQKPRKHFLNVIDFDKISSQKMDCCWCNFLFF